MQEFSDIPSSFDACVALIESAGEPLLHAHLVHDVHLVAYEPQKLVVRLTDHAPERFVKQLQDCLKKLTGVHWDIDLSDDLGQPTLAETLRTAKQNLMEETLGCPLVKEALKAFPGATLVDVCQKKEK